MIYQITGKQARNRLEEIKYLLKRGEMTYEQAKLFAEEPLKILNGEMARLAKEHGVPAKRVGFTSFMR
jgi:hypothetical protein